MQNNSSPGNACRVGAVEERILWCDGTGSVESGGDAVAVEIGTDSDTGVAGAQEVLVVEGEEVDCAVGFVDGCG